MARNRQKPQELVAVAFNSPTMVEDKFAVTLVNNAIENRRLRAVIAGAGARINRVRNQMVRDFLNLPPQFQWMWFVDTDMSLPTDALSQLLTTAAKKKRKVVGGLGYIYNPERQPALLASIIHYREDGETFSMNEPPKTRYVEADATGFFCLLVHRSVLVKMGQEFAHLNNPWIDENEQGAENTPVGPDMEFFARMKKATGETPLIDTEIRCGHIKKVTFNHHDAVRAWGMLNFVKEEE